MEGGPIQLVLVPLSGHNKASPEAAQRSSKTESTDIVRVLK